MAKFTKSFYTVIEGDIEDWVDVMGELSIFNSLKAVKEYVEMDVYENAKNPQDYTVYKLIAMGKMKPIVVEFDFNASE